jgi:hypothetical protein
VRPERDPKAKRLAYTAGVLLGLVFWTVVIRGVWRYLL